MEISALRIRALTITLVAAILAGCGAQNTGTIPQGAQPTLRASGSWMKSGTSSGDLIYVGSGDDVEVYSYPGGSLVGTLVGFHTINGLCADTHGNVWITNYTGYSGKGYLLEYAHGGTSPIATLAYSGNPYDCSWDPLTGNLAVFGGKVAVYSNASGSPAYYTVPGAWVAGIPFYISYDGSGDIYVLGRKRKAAWLPKGGSTVLEAHVKGKGGLQWDGTYLTILIATGTVELFSPQNGHSGKPVGSISLDDASGLVYDSIEGGLVAVAEPGHPSTGSTVYVYNYPQGGAPTLTISGLEGASGVAISVAPTRK